MPHLNSDHLRTFLAIDAAGSVTGGAERIGRSQSATSLQIRQLEDVVGQALFERHGRGVVLTRAGETLRPVARRVVQSLDRALAELRGEELDGRLKVGMPDDHSRSVLARILSDFVARHSRVELDVLCALGTGFEAALASGDLDLAVFEVPSPGPAQEVLREDGLVWVGSARHSFGSQEPLPVALFDRTCWWRDLALSSLERAGRPYRVVLTSESSVGVRAAVEAGMAAGLLSTRDDLDGLEPLDGLGSPLPTYLVLQRGAGRVTPACDALCDAIRRALLT